MAELPERITSPQNKMSEYVKENIEKPEAFWNYVLWTDETRIELVGHHPKRYV